MPQRNSRNQEPPPITPRRSPRFTPQVPAKKVRTTLSEVSKISLRQNKSTVSVTRRVTRASTSDTPDVPAKKASRTLSEVSKRSLRRSPRLNNENLQNNGIMRRVTRASIRDTLDDDVALGCESSAKRRKGENGSRVPKHVHESRVSTSTLGETKKPVPSSEVAGCGEDDNGTARNKNTGLKRKRTRGREETKHADESCTTTLGDTKKPVPLSKVAGCGEDDNGTTGKKNVCLKRKTAQRRKETSIANGWTSEQEVALQSAYFAAKATPNFWKRVARMVPGKSAKECFDKVHSDFLTPPQPQRRSRAKHINASSLSPCATKLLHSTEKNTNKLRHSKPKNHRSLKTVRTLLQKQYDTDRDKEADLFSVLESSADPTASVFCQNTRFLTPESNKRGLHHLKKLLDRSSSAHKKTLSRFNASSGASLTSPPVLKPIKNKALHEKYIDQLHCREVKRKAATSRKTKGSQNKNEPKDETVRKVDVIKAAKNALISEATDAIHQFKNVQMCALNSFINDDDDDHENHDFDDDAEDAI